MAYRLVIMERFLLIIGSGLLVSFMFMTAGAYYLTKLYYYMQMSNDTSKISKVLLKVFFYGMFWPIMTLFLANEMAIPLFATPTAEQLVAYKAGEISLNLIDHTLNTGSLYLVLMIILGTTFGTYYFFDKAKKQKAAKLESRRIADQQKMIYERGFGRDYGNSEGYGQKSMSPPPFVKITHNRPSEPENPFPIPGQNNHHL